jgi:phosphoglycerol geranylgeranyltransferase
MKFKSLIKSLTSKKNPLLAVLIDPDKFNRELVRLANTCSVHCFLVGGSKLESGDIKQTVKAIKQLSNIPVVLFPGDETQLCKEADGIFLPSLVSGLNPNYLIGKQTIMAPLIKKMQLPLVPMAYLLLNGNKPSSTQKVTGTQPLDYTHKRKIMNIALASEQLGFKLIYLEAGSGAKSSVPQAIIKKVKHITSLPVIVGGGINSKKKAQQAINAGANMIVIGNALEKDVYLLADISSCF